MSDLASYAFQVLQKDENFILYRGECEVTSSSILVLSPSAQHPALEVLKWLEHAYSLKGELDSRWAARPMTIARHWDRTVLIMEDPRGVPLDQLFAEPLDIVFWLRLAISLAGAIDLLHQRGIIHKDIKPANVLVDSTSGQCWLMGFLIASRLPRERQLPRPPEFITGTLAYMSPEQTGRMNRSIDARSDLYALGVTLYQTLTGSLPFTASDPMEWVHCHVARQPVPPGERHSNVPPTVSAIILKLLSKAAEERYQSAAGLAADLRKCLADWESHRRISSFSLGAHDVSERLLMPEKLYGREREIRRLLDAFDQVVDTGKPSLVLVSGYSGIGKSSLVNELHRVLVWPRGLFACGKFDQRKRDIPYATLAQAFQTLIRPLLNKSETELQIWRDTLRDALGPNGRLMVDLIPELKLVIGEQPPVPELPPQDAQHRFQLVFRRFVGVFARPEHPLALFLDDLQWLDAATLDFLEDLLTSDFADQRGWQPKDGSLRRTEQPDVHHLLLIGAYRDNEVDFTHPLWRRLEAISQAGAIVHQIVLAPLACEDLAQMIADCLHCELQWAIPLAQLVHEKTAGNPFFAVQFISALAEEGFLTFDRDATRWRWDLNRIRTKGYTDNVADLMVGKLTRLPVEAQRVLQQLACMGNSAEFTSLAMIQEDPKRDIHEDFWEAVRTGHVFRLEGSYQFIHDRVQEAAYSQISVEMRAAAHLKIGRLLLAQTRPENREEAIFEIVNQLNCSAALITAREEREQLAELNLIAGKRAQASSAYASALTYLITGAALLTEDLEGASPVRVSSPKSYQTRREISFALELNRAECEFLTGALEKADRRLDALSNRAQTTVERATVACLRMDVYTALDQSDRAVAICLDYLRHTGIDWTAHPTEEEARSEYERIWIKLGIRTIESLIDSPLLEDPASLATIDVLAKLLPPALFTDANLASMTICRAVSLSLERGNCDASCFAYVRLGGIAGPRFGDYKVGFAFGQLGHELVERCGLKRFEARTYLCLAIFITPWIEHVQACRDPLRRAFEAANRNGDLMYAAYACECLNSDLLFAGDPLSELQREAEHGLAFAEKARFGLVIDIITAKLALIRMLRGLKPKFGCLDDAGFNEPQMEYHLSSNPALAIAACWYWVRKLQARYIAGDYADAMDASSKAERLLWTSTSFLEEAEYHLYGALARAAVSCSATPDSKEEHLKALGEHRKQLAIWAEHCPKNFENRAALVGAEIARVEGRDLDAEHLYEQAIRSAQANGFVHNEALANELAARFYAARGFERIANAYLLDARYGYRRWGADGKVRQLDALYPHLRSGEREPGPIGTIGTSVEHLDLATVIKISQAVSGEIVLEKLIETLMRLAIEYAGAERGLLIFPRGVEQRIEAEAITSDESIIVRLGGGSTAEVAVPESIIHYVVRTQESAILDDASIQNPFSADDYLRDQHARSILCLPLINQGKLNGMLYLENNLTPNVFTPARIAVLKLLASQAAISLENTRLYRDLEEREAKIRRLLDANIIGICVWNLEGEIIEANEAFLHLVEYCHDDLLSGRLCWRELTPAEWRDRDERAVEELKATGTAQPFQKEYFRKDGSRVPVLLGAAMFEESRNEGVAFVLDLSEQKRAEEALLKAQAELAHVTRVTTLGEMTASIAHEVNQPLAAVVTSADASLRWLAEDLPNLTKAREAIRRIVRDGNRAGKIIGRVRALAKKAPPKKDWLNLNETIEEVIAMARSQLQQNRVSLQTNLENHLPLIMGDKIQLQQVILNLLMNAIEAMSGMGGEDPRELGG